MKNWTLEMRLAAFLEKQHRLLGGLFKDYGSEGVLDPGGDRWVF